MASTPPVTAADTTESAASPLPLPVLAPPQATGAGAVPGGSPPTDRAAQAADESAQAEMAGATPSSVPPPDAKGESPPHLPIDDGEPRLDAAGAQLVDDTRNPSQLNAADLRHQKGAVKERILRIEHLFAERHGHAPDRNEKKADPVLVRLYTRYKALSNELKQRGGDAADGTVAIPEFSGVHLPTPAPPSLQS